jgi:uncharacterized glyoxalase superfamily protein PhnB
MSTNATPKGYHSVTPTLIIRDAAAAIEFYKRVFDAAEIGRVDGPDGKVMHAEIRIGDSIVMLGEENVEWGMKSPLSLDGVPSSLYLYVEDADKSFERAVEAGASVRFPLEDTFWGDRFGKVADPFGHEWGLATRVREVSKEELRRAAQEWMAKAGQGGQEAKA